MKLWERGIVWETFLYKSKVTNSNSIHLTLGWSVHSITIDNFTDNLIIILVYYIIT